MRGLGPRISAQEGSAFAIGIAGTSPAMTL
jgi:hypothetical protein